MRKTYKKNIAYSVVPFGTSEQIFIVANPDENYTKETKSKSPKKPDPDWQLQIRSLLEGIRDLLELEGFRSGVVMSNFFISDMSKHKLLRQLVAEIFPEELGAMTIIPQTPVGGAVCAADIWAMKGNDMSVSKMPSDNVVLVMSNVIRWFFGGDFRADDKFVSAYDRSLDAFKKIREQLRPNLFQLCQLVRTWIYQGHLVAPDKTAADGELLRYQELNRARTDFFGEIKFLHEYLTKECKKQVFPASTGIGADDHDVVISAIAVNSLRDDFVVAALENPKQTSAFSYSKVYSPQSPKFARGVAVNLDNWCQIFVSGTASITNSESRYNDNVEKQTKQTLDNIAALIDGANLAKHGIRGFESDLSKLECVRVYVKRPDDFAAINAICQERLQDTPILYTIADVCRPELLVEIEGIAVTCRVDS
ncbi:MAG: hypothetical protein LBH59_11285 [Planctomycetaceae bacterium]|jgi:enamine deaminase RidA (YjgF/YER057c/UK114 family)|nr:hypothetical protein [Planctomycetaceae bacterium]